jgi:class 3 adenylate cyclase
VRVPVTILFSDLIGFTTLAEKADPKRWSHSSMNISRG